MGRGVVWRVPSCPVQCHCCPVLSLEISVEFSFLFSFVSPARFLSMLPLLFFPSIAAAEASTELRLVLVLAQVKQWHWQTEEQRQIATCRTQQKAKDGADGADGRLGQMLLGKCTRQKIDGKKLATCLCSLLFSSVYLFIFIVPFFILWFFSFVGEEAL